MSGRRFLGVDLGTRRVGVAVSDPSGTLASPLVQIEYGGDAAELVDRLATLVQNEGAVGIVVGDPRLASGDPSPGSVRAAALAQALAARLGLPVWLWNEWGTTAEAEEKLRQAAPAGRVRGAERAAKRRRDGRRRRERLDRAAAALVLGDFLAAFSGRELPPPVSPAREEE